MKRMLCLWMAVIMTLCACGQKEGTSLTWEEQYELGIRYLSEGNYEEAIIAFNAAIEIDPKRADAYLSLAEAYVAIGSPDKAAEILERGYAETGDENIRTQLEQISSGSGSGGADGSNADPESAALLGALFPYFEADDLEGVAELIRQEEYRAMADALTEGYSCLSQENGLALVLYPEGYYYYGQWTDGQRSGEGLWFRAVYAEDTAKDFYLYRGMWADDRPNGQGSILLTRDPAKLNLQPNQSTSIRTETTGSFKNGLYHGTIQMVWHMNDGSTKNWTPITAVDGVYQPMDNIPENKQTPPPFIDANQYLVAVEQNDPNTDLWESEKAKAVEGFAP